MATTQADFWNTGQRSDSGHVPVNVYLQKQVAAEFKTWALDCWSWKPVVKYFRRGFWQVWSHASQHLGILRQENGEFKASWASILIACLKTSVHLKFVLVKP